MGVDRNIDPARNSSRWRVVTSSGDIVVGCNVWQTILSDILVDTVLGGHVIQ